MKAPGSIRINGKFYNCDNFQQPISIDNSPWTTAIVDFLNDWYSNLDYIEVQTSGSTGEPKTIRLPKQSMVNSAINTCNYFKLNEESSALLCLPASYIAGKMMIVRALISGMNLITAKPSADPFENLHDIIDFSAITPYQFVNSYQSLQETAIKSIIVGGSAVSLKLEKMMETMDIHFFETYGMTETCSHIALRPINGVNASEYFEVLEGITISADERNCLVVKAPSLVEEELITNDVVELKDKTHFKWLGRYDNVINSGGIKIFPEQVEKKIEPLINRRFFVSAIPDDVLTQKIVLIIEGSPLKPEEENFLQQLIAENVSRFEKPRQIFYQEAFEASTSGKILKNKIISRFY